MENLAPSLCRDACALAGQAMGLLKDGRTREGIALYLRGLAASPAAVPVGLHLTALEQAGRQPAARALADTALRAGGNLGVKRFVPGASPAQIAADYERLFQRGRINALMVAEYLVALSRLGRADTLAALCDPARLFRTVRLESVDPAAVRAAVLAHLPDSAYQGAVASVRDMRHLMVGRLGDPVLEALLAACRRAVDAFMADYAAIDHPVSRWVARRPSLAPWAMISDGTGYNVPHVHHQGWYTGVYYATGLPEGDPPDQPGDAGCLRIGRPAAVAADAPGWPDLTVRPEPGLLVLMPSYYLHWTVPLGRPGLRIAIPFDVVDHPQDHDLHP